MEIYTYCSYKDSLSGYQYAKGSLEYMEPIESEIYTKNSKNSIPQYIREWFEVKYGWKLVLQQIGEENKGILLLGRLEQAVEIQKAQLLNKNEQIDAANRFRNNSSKEPKDDTNPDSNLEFFINIVFEGTVQELKKIAIFVLYSITEDGGVKILKEFESVFKKSESRKTYSVDPKLIRKYVDIAKKEVDEKAKKSDGDKKQKRENLFRFKKKTELNEVLEGKPSYKERKRRINEIMKLLFTTEHFSRNVILLVTEQTDMIDGKDIHILIDTSYLIGELK